MSDSRRRYDAVKQKLRQLLPDQWVACATRMTNLSLLVSAVVKAKDLTQHALAAEMPSPAQDTSLAQRQRRWLSNEQVDERACYEPVIVPFLQAVSTRTVPLLLDTTAAGVNCHLLTVAVGYQHRALPVAWRSGEGDRGHTDGATQIDLLDQVAGYFPAGTDVILLGDGEFGNVTLLSWPAAHHWQYALRVASDTYIKFEGQWRRIDSFDLKPGEVIWLPEVSLTRAQPFGPVNLLLIWDDRHQRAVPLVTNLPLPEETSTGIATGPGLNPSLGISKVTALISRPRAYIIPSGFPA